MRPKRWYMVTVEERVMSSYWVEATTAEEARTAANANDIPAFFPDTRVMGIQVYHTPVDDPSTMDIMFLHRLQESRGSDA